MAAQSATLYARNHNATPSAPTHPQNAKVYAKNHCAPGNATAQQTAKSHAALLYVKSPHPAIHSPQKLIAVLAPRKPQKPQRNAAVALPKQKPQLHLVQPEVLLDALHTTCNACPNAKPKRTPLN